MFLPIVQRQRNVLNLTYRHAVILTHRPYLLNIFAAHRQTGRTDDDDKYDEQQVATSVQQCLSNAMQTVETISHMTQSGQMSRAFWVRSLLSFA